MSKYDDFDSNLNRIIMKHTDSNEMQIELNNELEEFYRSLGVKKMFISGLETPEEFDENLANHLLEVLDALARKGNE